MFLGFDKKIFAPYVGPAVGSVYLGRLNRRMTESGVRLRRYSDGAIFQFRLYRGSIAVTSISGTSFYVKEFEGVDFKKLKKFLKEDVKWQRI